MPVTLTINEKARSSNITITTLDIDTASIEQGNKADSAIQSIQGNGKIIQLDFNRSVIITPENVGAAVVEHGKHVPSRQAADNSVFLRNAIIPGNRLLLKTSALRQRSKVKKLITQFKEFRSTVCTFSLT